MVLDGIRRHVDPRNQRLSLTSFSDSEFSSTKVFDAFVRPPRCLFEEAKASCRSFPILKCCWQWYPVLKRCCWYTIVE